VYRPCHHLRKGVEEMVYGDVMHPRLQPQGIPVTVVHLGSNARQPTIGNERDGFLHCSEHRSSIGCCSSLISQQASITVYTEHQVVLHQTVLQGDAPKRPT
jgi:hypothetical protein